MREVVDSHLIFQARDTREVLRGAEPFEIWSMATLIKEALEELE